MEKTRRLLTVVLSLLVLVGSSGFLLSAHYCGGNLQHISLLNEAPSCHDQSGCHQTAKQCCADSQDKGCCHNEDVLADADLTYHVDGPKIVHDQADVVAPLPNLVKEMFQVQNRVVPRFKPPPKDVRLNILYQVFRC